MWLQCLISPGQFSREYIVQGISIDKTEFALFADESTLRFKGNPTIQQPISGWINVTPLNQEGERLSVALPQSTFLNGNIVHVSSQLVNANP